LPCFALPCFALPCLGLASLGRVVGREGEGEGVGG
jgi:hypothetical protein